MKYFIFLTLLLLFGCSNDFDSNDINTNNDPAIFQSKETEVGKDPLSFLTQSPNFKTNFGSVNQWKTTLKEEGAIFNSLYLKYYKQIASSTVGEWPLLIENIKQDVGNYNQNNKVEFTNDIQQVSLRALRLYLLEQTPSQIVANDVYFFLNILTEHKSYDIDVLADAYKFVEPFYPDDNKLDEAKLNIQDQLNNKRNYVENNFLMEKQRYENSEGVEKAISLAEGKHMVVLNDEIEYVVNLLNLN